MIPSTFVINSSLFFFLFFLFSSAYITTWINKFHFIFFQFSFFLCLIHIQKKKRAASMKMASLHNNHQCQSNLCYMYTEGRISFNFCVGFSQFFQKTIGVGGKKFVKIEFCFEVSLIWLELESNGWWTEKFVGL